MLNGNLKKTINYNKLICYSLQTIFSKHIHTNFLVFVHLFANKFKSIFNIFDVLFLLIHFWHIYLLIITIDTVFWKLYWTHKIVLNCAVHNEQWTLTHRQGNNTNICIYVSRVVWGIYLPSCGNEWMHRTETGTELDRTVFSQNFESLKKLLNWIYSTCYMYTVIYYYYHSCRVCDHQITALLTYTCIVREREK